MDMEVAKNLRILTQDRPPNTNAYAILNASTKRKLVLTNINVVNTTNAAALYSLYLCKSGTTYDQTTALRYNESVAANTAVHLTFGEFGLPMDYQYTNNLAIQVGTTNAFTVTVVGMEL